MYTAVSVYIRGNGARPHARRVALIQPSSCNGPIHAFICISMPECKTVQRICHVQHKAVSSRMDKAEWQHGAHRFSKRDCQHDRAGSQRKCRKPRP
jgi:hypothetical protein